jgi:hypothetical protein
LAVVVAVACVAIRAGANEATGKVTESGWGSFNLDEKGTVREFSLSYERTVYDPASWRPTPGDEASVVFTNTAGKRGEVLLVTKVKLRKAGPDTLPPLANPVTVVIDGSRTDGRQGEDPHGPSYEVHLCKRN